MALGEPTIKFGTGLEPAVLANIRLDEPKVMFVGRDLATIEAREARESLPRASWPAHSDPRRAPARCAANHAQERHRRQQLAPGATFQATGEQLELEQLPWFEPNICARDNRPLSELLRMHQEQQQQQKQLGACQTDIEAPLEIQLACLSGQELKWRLLDHIGQLHRLRSASFVSQTCCLAESGNFGFEALEANNVALEAAARASACLIEPADLYQQWRKLGWQVGELEPTFGGADATESRLELRSLARSELACEQPSLPPSTTRARRLAAHDSARSSEAPKLHNKRAAESSFSLSSLSISNRDELNGCKHQFASTIGELSVSATTLRGEHNNNSYSSSNNNTPSRVERTNQKAGATRGRFEATTININTNNARLGLAEASPDWCRRRPASERIDLDQASQLACGDELDSFGSVRDSDSDGQYRQQVSSSCHYHDSLRLAFKREQQDSDSIETDTVTQHRPTAEVDATYLGPNEANSNSDEHSEHEHEQEKEQKKELYEYKNVEFNFQGRAERVNNKVRGEQSRIAIETARRRRASNCALAPPSQHVRCAAGWPEPAPPIVHLVSDSGELAEGCPANEPGRYCGYNNNYYNPEYNYNLRHQQRPDCASITPYGEPEIGRQLGGRLICMADEPAGWLEEGSWQDELTQLHEQRLLAGQQALAAPAWPQLAESSSQAGYFWPSRAGDERDDSGDSYLGPPASHLELELGRAGSTSGQSRRLLSHSVPLILPSLANSTTRRRQDLGQRGPELDDGLNQLAPTPMAAACWPAASLWAPNHHYHRSVEPQQQQQQTHQPCGRPVPPARRQNQLLADAGGQSRTSQRGHVQPDRQAFEPLERLGMNQQDRLGQLQPAAVAHSSLTSSAHQACHSAGWRRLATPAASVAPHDKWTPQGWPDKQQQQQTIMRPGHCIGAATSGEERRPLDANYREQDADEQDEHEPDGLSMIPIEAQSRMSAQVAAQMKAQASNFVHQYKASSRKKAHFGQQQASGAMSDSSNGHGTRSKPELKVRRTLSVKIKKRRPILGIAIEGGFNVSGQLLPRIVCVHEDGAAYHCGKLRVSDLILEVNGISTVNMSHDEIAETIAVAYYQDPRPYIEFLVGETSPA